MKLLRNFILMILLMSATSGLQALTINFEVENQNRVKLKDFALSLVRLDKAIGAAGKIKSEPKTYEMIQKDKSFLPRVLVIQKGSKVVFPNKDDTSHSIYSFSEAKKFNVELYKGADKVPELVFTEEGVIVLGCNIHDWMLGVIVVTDSSHAAFSSKNLLEMTDLDPGTYEVKLWHKDLGVEKLMTLPQKLTIQNEQNKQTIKLTVDVKSEEAW